MRIGELAHRTGITTKTLRYYEQIGLLYEPERHANGYRDYPEEAVERVRFIRDAQATGLSLAETGEILAMKAAGESSCQHTLDILARHLADVDAQIERLLVARAELRAMADRASSMDPETCTDPARCQIIGARADAASDRSRPVPHRELLPLA